MPAREDDGKLDPRFGSARPARAAGALGTAVPAVLTVVWLLVVGLYAVLAAPEGGWSGQPLAFPVLALGLALPVALVWLAAATLRSLKAVQDETDALRSAIEGLRRAGDAPQAGRRTEPEAGGNPAPAGGFVSRRAVTPAAPQPHRAAETPGGAEPEAEAQPSLGFDASALPEPEPLAPDDFVRALDFPESEDDTEGFRALRRALQDHEVARLVRAAQDVLTLLSEDGVYMDDLSPDRARPELWRSFAEGARGGAIAGLGGVRDRDSLATVAARMRQDPVFRDAAHHFLRQFDRCFAGFAGTASDQDVARFSDTRSARAFMLLGRVTGIFD